MTYQFVKPFNLVVAKRLLLAEPHRVRETWMPVQDDRVALSVNEWLLWVESRRKRAFSTGAALGGEADVIR